MEHWLTCPRGHRWQVIGEITSATPSRQASCPVCGDPCVTVGEEELDWPTLLTCPPAPQESDDRADTLQLPNAEVPVSEAARPAAEDHEFPQSLPPYPAIPGYQIQGLMGKGGMGVVYRARQVAVNRTVAIKMLRSAGAEERARFRREAEAVARLQHPGIIQVFEVGEVNGAPFFSLEFCAGGSLDAKLKDHPLEAREAARLVELITRAVQAAHEEGIIHRDLKPGNILLARDPRAQRESKEATRSSTSAGGFWRSTVEVNAEPSPLRGWVPKVGDFGLAREIVRDQNQDHTRTGAIVGSPCYMAPEQAAGDGKRVGPAADVYALGVILYECLTGRPPFKAPNLLLTLQQICTQEPVPPRRLQRSVPADLETICLKCLEKEPARRYASALELAEDLQRFLDNEPIRARPPSWAKRLYKWARRRPAVASLTTLLALACLTGLGGGLWYHWRLEVQKQKAEDNFHRAEKNFALALRAVDAMLTEVAGEELPEGDEKRRALLEKALGFYQEMLQFNANNPLLRERVATGYRRVGDIQRLLGRRDKALAAYALAVKKLQDLNPTVADRPDLVWETAHCHNWTGELERGTSLDRAEASYRQALALQNALVKQHPGNGRYRCDQGRSHDNLGLVAKARNQPEQALQAFAQAIRILDQLVTQDPADPTYRQHLARALVNQGTVLARTQPAQAADAYRRARDLQEEIIRSHPEERGYRYELGACLTDLGNLFFRSRQQEKARATLEEAQQRLLELVQDYPKDPRYREALANACNSRATVLAIGKDFDRAQQVWETSEKEYLHLIGRPSREIRHHVLLGRTLGNRGTAYLRQDRLPEARRYLDRSLRELLAVLKSHPDNQDAQQLLRRPCQSYAVVLVRLEDHEAARQQARVLAQHARANGQGPYRAVCLLARCVRELQGHQDMKVEEIQAYTTLAQELIRACGPSPVPLRPLLKDPDFEPFRRQPEFQALLAPADIASAAASTGPGGEER
jgi:serine/threonine protein kinase